MEARIISLAINKNERFSFKVYKINLQTITYLNYHSLLIEMNKLDNYIFVIELHHVFLFCLGP